MRPKIEEKKTVISQLMRILALIVNTIKAFFLFPKTMLREGEALVKRTLLARRTGKDLASLDDPLAVRFLPGIAPFDVNIDENLESKPTLNVLIPGLALKEMSGGPNTAINLSYRLAAQGIRLRYISTCAPKEKDDEKLWDHIQKLTGLPRYEGVEFCCAFNRSTPVTLGRNDIFFATAWWTAQMVKHVQNSFRQKKFVYMIQDFEPGFYGWSSVQALAMETYGFDFFGVINSEMLMRFLVDNKVGRFREFEVGKDFVYFNPAIDRSVFQPREKPSSQKRLVFYARPLKGERNLYDIGVHVIREGLKQGILDDSWDIVFMGESLPRIPLYGKTIARPAPWMSYQDYGKFIAESDMVFSLMLSPHPSYPPLEGASAGVCVLTNEFGGKSKKALEGLSNNIVAVKPTIAELLEGLKIAVKLAKEKRNTGKVRAESIHLPNTWDESFENVLPSISRRVKDLLFSEALKTHVADRPFAGEKGSSL